MKSATLLSSDQRLLEVAISYCVEQGGAAAPDSAQFQLSSGQMFTIEDIEEESLWEIHDDPFVPAVGSEPVTFLQLKSMQAITAECRFEWLFRDVVEALAVRLTQPLWVLDANNVLWPAVNIDLNRFVL